jgi:ADP-ribosylation factor-like protein 5B
VWDLGGQASLRPSWATYYPSTDAVIVVVDSTDRARISICKQELFSLLGHEHLHKAVVLIFANKSDLKDAMTVSELSEALDLIRWAAKRKWGRLPKMAPHGKETGSL